MVFHCRCFSLSFVEEEKEIEYDTTTPTKSSSNQTFYTASSDFNRSISDSQTTRSDFSNLNEKSTNLRVFTVAELKEATGNFCESSKIGDGRFGSVHKGTIESSEYPFHEIQVAVKHANGRLLGQEDWLSKAIHFGVVEHPNLVKLIGYCAEDDEFGTHHLLVYEYMPNRSVADHLSMRTNTPLSWTMRLKVAQDVARGLAYLHERMDVLNIFGDFKSSNILLDDQWNAKLSDFGLTHINVSTPVTMGYVAPEYITRGYFTVKSDVWSYGVFLYELITGRRPLDTNRPKNEQVLLEWVKPLLDSKKWGLIIDPRLEGNYSLKSAQKLSTIANMCLSRDPKSRPNMSEVLEMVNQVIKVPSQATKPAPPPKSLVRVAATKFKEVFICTSKTKVQNVSKRRKKQRRMWVVHESPRRRS